MLNTAMKYKYTALFPNLKALPWQRRKEDQNCNPTCKISNTDVLILILILIVISNTDIDILNTPSPLLHRAYQFGVQFGHIILVWSPFGNIFNHGQGILYLTILLSWFSFIQHFHYFLVFSIINYSRTILLMFQFCIIISKISSCWRYWLKIKRSH